MAIKAAQIVPAVADMNDASLKALLDRLSADETFELVRLAFPSAQGSGPGPVAAKPANGAFKASSEPAGSTSKSVQPTLASKAPKPVTHASVAAMLDGEKAAQNAAKVKEKLIKNAVKLDKELIEKAEAKSQKGKQKRAAEKAKKKSTKPQETGKANEGGEKAGKGKKPGKGKEKEEKMKQTELSFGKKRKADVIEVSSDEEEEEVEEADDDSDFEVVAGPSKKAKVSAA